MGGRTRDEFDTALLKKRQSVGDEEPLVDRVTAVFYAACDEEGSRLFTTEEDLKELSDIDNVCLHRMFIAANELNSLDRTARDAISKN